MTTNYLTLYVGLKIFRDAMLPFIVEKLQAAHGDNWWEQGVAHCFKPEDIERFRILFEKRHDSLVVERPGDELAEILVRSGYARDESLWTVAQALSEILPEGDKEKQMLQGLLGSKERLVSEVRQERLL